MHDDLVKRLLGVRKRRNFKVDEWIETKIDLLLEYLQKSGLSACVISLSGGVDSSSTLGLLMRAKARPNSPLKRVLGIAQPIHSTDSIQNRAFEVAEALGAEVVTVDQSELHTQLCDKVESAVKVNGDRFARGQLRSYMRTPVAYYVAQLLTQNGTPCVVMGTGNLDEDGYLLYFCKAGDGVVDVQLIADIHKREVFEVAERLGVPESVLKAKPSADLWEGQTDEDEMGFTYDMVELVTEYLALSDDDKTEFRSACSEEAWREFEEARAKAEAIHRRNAHKANFPVNLNCTPQGTRL